MAGHAPDGWSADGGELSLTEYVDRLNVIVDQARQEYEVLVASPGGGVATAAIDPPDQVAALHHLFFDFDSDFISAQEALSVRAGTAADWAELSDTPWIPDELKELFEVALGCDGYPEHPEDVYRPLAADRR